MLENNYLYTIVKRSRDSHTGFARRLTSPHFGLSFRELEVANLIRNGKSSKEAAGVLGISLSAVLFHRNNIRHKMGLKNKKMQLNRYLQELE